MSARAHHKKVIRHSEQGPVSPLRATLHGVDLNRRVPHAGQIIEAGDNPAGYGVVGQLTEHVTQNRAEHDAHHDRHDDPDGESHSSSIPDARPADTRTLRAESSLSCELHRGVVAAEGT